jgi:hypothetical protein
MKKITTITIALLALTACGSKTYYVNSTEVPNSPETTVKVVKTTDAPIATTPPVTWTAEDEFIADVNNGYSRPIYSEDAELIEAAYGVCDALRNGGTAYEVLDAIVSSAEGDRDTEELLTTVVAAGVVNFCPEQQYKFDN